MGAGTCDLANVYKSLPFYIPEAWKECVNGVNRQPSNGPKFNRHLSKNPVRYFICLNHLFGLTSVFAIITAEGKWSDYIEQTQALLSVSC